MKLEEFRLLMNSSDMKTLEQMSTEEILQNLLEKGVVFKNIYQELEMDSRYVNAHQDISHSTDAIDLHSHTFYELLYCQRGSIQYLLGGQRYQLRPGDVVLIPPGVGHQPLFPPQMIQPYQRSVVWISCEFAEFMFSKWPGLRKNLSVCVLRIHNTPWSFLQDLFQQACTEAQSQADGWEASICGLASQLLVWLHRAISQDAACLPQAEQPDLLDQVLAYIQEHLDQRITLTDTARHFLVSSSTISQLFRARLGVSFYHTVTLHRLVEAKRMILEDIPLEEVHHRVGFAEYSTFYRAFRRETGLSPSQFRQLHRSGSGG